MNIKYLLPEERVVQETKDKQFTITNLRICHASGDRITTIPLKKVSCVKMHSTESIYFLIFGIICGLLGGWLLMDNTVPQGQGFIMLLIAAVLIAVYFQSRRSVFSIYSDSGESISFQTKGISRDNLIDFLNNIDGAIHRNPFEKVPV